MACYERRLLELIREQPLPAAPRGWHTSLPLKLTYNKIKKFVSANLVLKLNIPITISNLI